MVAEAAQHLVVAPLVLQEELVHFYLDLLEQAETAAVCKRVVAEP